MIASNAKSSGDRNVTPGSGITVASFAIKNDGNTAVDLKYVTIRRTDESMLDVSEKIKGLRLFDSSGNQVSKDTQGKSCTEFDATANTVKLELKDKIRIAKGETKTFEVKIGAEDTMSDKHSLNLGLIPEETCYGKAGSDLRYEIAIDNADDVNLGTAVAKA